MSSKRKLIKASDELEQDDYKSDDSDTSLVTKKNKTNIFGDCNAYDSEGPSFDFTTGYVRIAENEIDEQHNLFNFVEKSGPQCSLTHEAKPIEYFNLFFNYSLWTLIVEETNKYAEKLSKSNLSSRSTMKSWNPVTILEMKAFVAVLLEMNITRRPTIYSYWTENSRSIPWFKQMFSRNRFQQILSCFHLVDNEEWFPPGHEKHDLYAKLNPIIEHVNKTFKLYYTPHKQLVIDELFAKTHSSNFMQYLPNKKYHHCGIKYWTLCDAVSNYCISFCSNHDANLKADDVKIKNMGLGYNVVVNLLQQNNYLNKGYHIFVSTFFTSTVLAKYLYSNNTYLTGMIKKDRKDTQNEVNSNKISEISYFRNGEVILCKYFERCKTRNSVSLLSTQPSPDTAVTNKRSDKNTQATKSYIIDTYNRFMGGIEPAKISDKMLYTYLDERRSLKYWKKITFHIFARMVSNSYLIYKETVGRKAMSRLEFTSSIISDIECEWRQERKNQFFAEEKKTYGLIKLPGRNLRQCVVCSSRTDGIKRSNLICVQCKKGLHPLCFDKHVCV